MQSVRNLSHSSPTVRETGGREPGRRSPAEERAGSFVEALVRIGVEVVTQRELAPAEQAREAMREVSDRMCVEFARAEIYIPVSYDARNREIVRKWNTPSRSAGACTPQRVTELAREFAMSTRQIYIILRRVREQVGAATSHSCPGAIREAT